MTVPACSESVSKVFLRRVRRTAFSPVLTPSGNASLPTERCRRAFEGMWKMSTCATPCKLGRHARRSGEGRTKSSLVKLGTAISASAISAPSLISHAFPFPFLSPIDNTLMRQKFMALMSIDQSGSIPFEGEAGDGTAVAAPWSSEVDAPFEVEAVAR